MSRTTHDPPCPDGCSPWTRNDEGTVDATMSELPAGCEDWPPEPARTCPPDLEPDHAIDPDEWIDEVPAAGAWC